MLTGNGNYEYDLVGGGKFSYGKIIDVGDGYRVPTIEEFVDGFEYERTDGKDWFKKVYRSYMKDGRLCEYQRGDVELLIPQCRVRVKMND